MASAADDFLPMRFSTDDLPGRHHQEIVQEVIGRSIMRVLSRLAPLATRHEAWIS